MHFLPERLVRLLIFLHPQRQRREFIPLALDLRAQVYHIDDRVKQKHHYRCPDKDHPRAPCHLLTSYRLLARQTDTSFILYLFCEKEKSLF